MSEEQRVKAKTIVHFRDGPTNPVIEIGEDYLIEFLRHVADREGFSDRELSAVQLIVEDKALILLPKIQLMVSNIPNSRSVPEKEETANEPENKPQVERSVDIQVPNTRKLSSGTVDAIGWFPPELLNASDEEFEQACESFRYEPEVKDETNDG